MGDLLPEHPIIARVRAVIVRRPTTSKRGIATRSVETAMMLARQPPAMPRGPVVVWTEPLVDELGFTDHQILCDGLDEAGEDGVINGGRFGAARANASESRADSCKMFSAAMVSSVRS